MESIGAEELLFVVVGISFFYIIVLTIIYGRKTDELKDELFAVHQVNSNIKKEMNNLLNERDVLIDIIYENIDTRKVNRIYGARMDELKHKGYKDYIK